MTAMALSGPIGRHVMRFSVLFVLAFGCLLCMVRWFPRRLTLSQGLLLAFGLGTAVRFIFLPFPPSYDIHRYIWEGYLQTLGFNPYVIAPNHPSMMPVAEQLPPNIWQHINHKELTACYPPFSMILFRLLAYITVNPLHF